MGWDDKPPTSEELAPPSWDSTPPTAQELSGAGEPTVSLGDKADAFVQGISNLATGGHMPQIHGAFQHPVGALKALLKGGVGQDVSQDPDVKAYSQARDQWKNEYDKSWNQNPLAYGAGGAVGLVASPLNKLGVIPAAGVMAEGASNADLTKGQIGKDAGDTAKGIATAYILNKALQAGAGKVSDMLGSKSDLMTARAMKGTAGQYGALGEEGAADLGRAARENGLVKFGDKPMDILNRANEAKETAWSQMEPALQQEGTALSGPELASHINEQIIPQIAENNATSSATSGAQSIADNLADREGIPLDTLQNIKKNLATKVYSDTTGAIQSPELLPVERYLNDQINTAVGAADYPGFQAAKASYATAAETAKLAAKGAFRGYANQGIGLGDKAAGAIGGMVAGKLGAAAGGILNKVTRERGASAAAVSLDSLSNLVKKAPQLFGAYGGALSAAASRGPDALAASHYVLSQQSPEYRSIIDNLPADDTNVTQ